MAIGIGVSLGIVISRDSERQTRLGPMPNPPTQVVIVRGLPLEVKVGQLLMSGFVGVDAATEASSLIESFHVGNLLLLEQNIVDPMQVSDLTKELQQQAVLHNSGIGALIAADQEGGTIARMKAIHGFTEFPSAAVFGCVGDVELTESAARVVGNEMYAVGVNLNLAPVLDVNDNPANPVIGVRSFGASPEQVAAHGLAALSGLSAAGIGTTLKHFPGHGNTSVDSHLELPAVLKSRMELLQTEIEPFRQAILTGDTDVVMTAHVMYPSLDPSYPATLSLDVLELLRNDLGFDGVVMTDSLNMGAITDSWTVEDAAVLAIEAGVDILAFRFASSVPGIFTSIIQAVQSGRISEERVDQSVASILRLKARLGAGPSWGGDFSEVGTEDPIGLSTQVLEAATAAACLN